MGRTVIADESVIENLDSMIKKISSDSKLGNPKLYIGVMIGQQTAQKDYVVHIARTPDPVEDEAHEETIDDDNDVDGGAKDTGSANKLRTPKSFTELDDQWVLVHAKQVTRMLPGGLNIVGLFAIASSAVLKEGQTKIRQMMYSVYKQLDKDTSRLSSSSQITERILMQMDTSTKRVTCVSLDTADSKKGTKPAEWKQQSGGSKWCCLRSTINMDIPIFVPSQKSDLSLLKQIQFGLSEFQSCLDQSMVTINGGLQDGSNVLTPRTSTKVSRRISASSNRASLQSSLPVNFKGRRQSSTSSPGNAARSRTGSLEDPWNQDVCIYLPFQVEQKQDEINSKDCKANISISGTSMVRSFVSTKCTFAEAVEAVKMDVMRSISARCDLLCEEFDVAELDVASQVYDPPSRLFVQLPHTSVQFCDYVFQDENFEDVMVRIRELLDIDVFEIEQVERSAANEGNISQPALPKFVDAVLEETAQELRPTRSNSGTFLGIGAALAGIVGLVATAVSYLWENDSEKV